MGFVDIFRKHLPGEGVLFWDYRIGFAFTEYRLEDRSHNRNAAMAEASRKVWVERSLRAMERLDHTAVVGSFEI